MFARHTPEIFAAQIRALLARPDASPLLDAVRCPTLVLVGREDLASPVPQHEEIAARVAGSRLVIVPDCGHMTTLERPAAVAAAMTDWLACSALD
jgi:pimeloyl-ACP methyl ester carboxylesterase